MKEARFIVDTHCHITTLYKKKPELKYNKIRLGGGYVYEKYDNSPLCLHDMKTYGVDMCILLPSWPGTTNKMQAMLVNKYPDKFRAMCADQELRLKCAKGEAEWSLEAAVEEVDATLKTGNHVGIGEFVPRNFAVGFEYTERKRLDEFRKFLDLAVKHDVAVNHHESISLLRRYVNEYPEVPIVVCHGGGRSLEGVKAACSAASRASGRNVYLETGCYVADYFEVPLKDPNVTATQLVWGHDYGNVPQYVFKYEGKYKAETYASSTTTRDYPSTPMYQTDFWGWALYQIHKLRDLNLVTQDEINLILGGNAAKVFKLPVPHPRMFPSGRPDLWGINWKKSVPFLPAEQIQNPDTPQPYFSTEGYE